MRRRVAIVGAEEKKFTPKTKLAAERLIRRVLSVPDVVLVSGHCHLGGIDIWSEDIAEELHAFDSQFIYPPKVLNWPRGYRPRNIKIAKACEEIHNITVEQYHPGYDDMRFKSCYHCDDFQKGVISHSHHFDKYKMPPHVKSGGCWTTWLANLKYKKPAYFYIIKPSGEVILRAFGVTHLDLQVSLPLTEK